MNGYDTAVGYDADLDELELAAAVGDEYSALSAMQLPTGGMFANLARQLQPIRQGLQRAQVTRTISPTDLQGLTRRVAMLEQTFRQKQNAVPAVYSQGWMPPGQPLKGRAFPAGLGAVALAAAGVGALALANNTSVPLQGERLILSAYDQAGAVGRMDGMVVVTAMAVGGDPIARIGNVPLSAFSPESQSPILFNFLLMPGVALNIALLALTVALGPVIAVSGALLCRASGSGYQG